MVIEVNFKGKMWLLVFIIVSTVTYFYLNVSEIYKYWKKKGIACIKPRLFFGNMAGLVFRTQSPVEMIRDFYTAYPDQRYVGLYQFLRPTLLIRDPELIKQITVKEFDSFPNHGVYSSNESDPIATKNLFNLSTENGWRDMRITLSPSFTGCKMRAMFLLMDKCADQFIDHFTEKGNFLTVEVKDAFRRYTNDVVAATAFGIDSNSLKHPTNEFYTMSRDLTNFDGFRGLKIFGYTISPILMKLFRVSVFNKRACEFFNNIIKESVRIREEKQIIRPDMIHLLMEARKKCLRDDNPKSTIHSQIDATQKPELLLNTRNSKNVKISLDDITAQTLAFFFAGFETSSTLMSYIAYELALNSTIQRKLREEVDGTLKTCNGKITYEAMMGMRYLDKVISEALRKWPPEACLDRRSQKPFFIEAERPGEKLLYLESGTVCWIPIYPIHRDPKYYPDPERFDPERFSDQNKHSIKPYTFLPFGCGPRNCIGSRFAILETKLIILRILQRFEIVPVNRTVKKIKLSPGNYTLIPSDGFWLGLKPRPLYCA